MPAPSCPGPAALGATDVTDPRRTLLRGLGFGILFSLPAFAFAFALAALCT